MTNEVTTYADLKASLDYAHKRIEELKQTRLLLEEVAAQRHQEITRLREEVRELRDEIVDLLFEIDRLT
jgi:predicted nuclease with TOPRIM domain